MCKYNYKLNYFRVKRSYLDKFAIADPADSTTPLCRHFNNTLTIILMEFLTCTSDCISIPISLTISHDTYVKEKVVHIPIICSYY